MRRTQIMFLRGINLATYFDFQQAITRLCVRNWKDKTLQLQVTVAEGSDVELVSPLCNINCNKTGNVRIT